jgi:hypothetical protein
VACFDGAAFHDEHDGGANFNSTEGAGASSITKMEINEKTLVTGQSVIDAQLRTDAIPNLFKTSAGATYTFASLATKALAAAGDAGNVDWTQVEDATLAKSIGQDQQEPQKVLDALLQHSPGSITTEQQDALRTRLAAFMERIHTKPEKLWVATVEHNEIPGVIPTLFFQEEEPIDKDIKQRFIRSAKPSEMTVTAVFDLSHIVENDNASRKALEAMMKQFSERVVSEPDSPTP